MSLGTIIKPNEIKSLSKVRYTITYTSWSSSVNADGYYTYSLTLSRPLKNSIAPNVLIAGVIDVTQPTDAQITQYSYVKRCYLSGTTLTLYAKTKPTSTFYIYVEGVAGSGSGSIVGNIIQPNGAVSGVGIDYSHIVNNISVTLNTWKLAEEYTFLEDGIYAIGLYPSYGGNTPSPPLASMITYKNIADPENIGQYNEYQVYAVSPSNSSNCSCIKRSTANEKMRFWVKYSLTGVNNIRIVITKIADLAS